MNLKYQLFMLMEGKKLLVLVVAVIILTGGIFFFNRGEVEAIAYTQVEDDSKVTSDINSYMKGDNLVIEYITDEDQIWIE